MVPYYLLKQVNISLCHHLLTQLTRPHHRAMRGVLLVLIIEQCRSNIRLERCVRAPPRSRGAVCQEQ